jgi:5-methylcytosine-specific restriction endonuclease McrA
MIAINQNPLSRLSDSKLIRRLNELVQKERETTLDIIRHIIEFDRRQLYLGLGHSSLFDYCTLQLGYSGSSAQRRIKTARCIIEFPEILGLLEKNELNLTGACLLSDILTAENKSELLKEVRFKSKRGIEQIVARFRPGKDIIDRVKPVFVSALPQQAADTSDGASHKFVNSDDGANQTSGNSRKSDNNPSGDSGVPDSGFSPHESMRNNSDISTATGGSRTRAGAAGSRQQTPILKKKYKLEFAVEPECMKKIEEAKALLSRKYPEGVPLGIILEEALDAYLDKHSSRRKKERREKRRETRQKKREADSAPHTHRSKKNSNISNRSRHIPQAIQDAVFARDKGRCTYVGRDGKRCSSTWNLHIDHIIPFARGGGHSVDNLRLLCGRHNQLEAENTYGKEFMAEKRRKAIPLIL